MKKNKMFSPIQLVRLIVQIAFFILLPGLYVNAFAGIREIYTGLIHQNFSLSEHIPQLVGVIAVVPATILLGRFFCGWMCAFGTMGDILYYFSRKVFKVSFEVNEKTDRILKYLKFIILGFLFIVVWSLGALNIGSASPWNVFGILVAFGKLPDFSYAVTEFTIGFLILVAIIAASFFVERFFCRYLCPLGAVFTIISRFRLIKIKKPGQLCGSCKACTKSCSMAIPLYKHDKINSGECIYCFNCITACPRSNAGVNIANEEIRNGVAATLAVAFMSGSYFTGNLVAEAINSNDMNNTNNINNTNNTNNTNNITASSDQPSKSAGSIYKDGTYEGSGTGFRGATTTVSVTIKNDKISDINVVSHGDDEPWFNPAYRSVTSQILSTQSTDVDAVSGATYSSMGIMEAVSNALQNAKTGVSAPAQEKSVGSIEEKSSGSIEEKSSGSSEMKPGNKMKPDRRGKRGQRH